MQKPPFIPTQQFMRRRAQLKRVIKEPILLMGNTPHARNFPANHLPFRQDSTFWYFSNCTIPGAAMLLIDGEDILFLPPQDPNDALWHGSQESNADIARGLGFHRWESMDKLEGVIQTLLPGPLHSIAIASHPVNEWLTNTLHTPFVFGKQNGSTKLIKQIVTMRRIMDEWELDQFRWTSTVTEWAHDLTISLSKTGESEHKTRSRFVSYLHEYGTEEAYNTICTTKGEVLHNHNYDNNLDAGKLLLLDGGAESPYGYATDVTRTWPTSLRFTTRQRVAYNAVLQAQQVAIDMVRPTVRTKDIHIAASLELAKFLVDENLLTCNAEDAVESGVHALFFPHGIGHLLGLDVHDMENFGDVAAYSEGRTRSKQFGLSYLRMDLDLQPNMVVTIEPGFYIVPAILDNPRFRSTFKSLVNWEQVEQWRGFGGIRIEDNIRCTFDAPENFSARIVKDADKIEQLRAKHNS